MNTPIEQLPIDSITVGERLRTDMGDIDGLAESIQANGLFHPLIVDAEGNLIAGHRRLKALRQLGFIDVSVRRWGTLDADQRRLIELEENIRRKDLTEVERSRKVKELAAASASVISTESVEIQGPGRPPKNRVSQEKIAEFIGIPESTIRDAEKHVAAVDAYPFLEQPGWKQYHAMEAAEALDKLPEVDRPVVANMINEPGIPPRTALKMLHTIANKPERDRKEIIRLATSKDDRERTLAKTKAAEVPPMPDTRLEFIHQARELLKKAVKLYPNDPEVPAFQAFIDGLSEVAKNIRERTKAHDFAAD